MSFNRDSEGIIQMTLAGSVVGLREPLSQFAEQGYDAEYALAGGRISEVFNKFKSMVAIIIP